MTELALPPGELSRHRRPRVGYAMTIVAATLFAVNGAVAKIGLEASDMGTLRWTELRSTGGFLGLAVGLALFAPHRLRIGTRRELGWLAFYGIVGFAVVQWLYFVAIARLPIGIGLLFEFSAPVLIALWARFAWHEPVRRRVWPALGLVIVGLALVAQVWHGISLDGIGVTAGLLAAVALVGLLPDGRTARRPPRPALGRLLRARLRVARWAIVLPWWNFPTETLRISVELPHGLFTVRSARWRSGGSCSARSSVLALGRRAQAPARDDGGDRGDVRAGRRGRDRLGVARGGARRGADRRRVVVLVGILLAETSR